MCARLENCTEESSKWSRVEEETVQMFVEILTQLLMTGLRQEQNLFYFKNCVDVSSETFLYLFR